MPCFHAGDCPHQGLSPEMGVVPHRITAALILWVGLCCPWVTVAAQQVVATTSSTTPSTREIVDDPESIGTDIRALLTPQRRATISSLVSARIRQIHFREGDRFKKGEVLVSFECEVLKARLQSDLAKLKQYELTYNANRELRKNDAVSKLDLALSGAKVEEGKAEVALARAQLRKCTVRAPYNGRIVEVVANEFENANIGDTLIAILDDEKLEMILHLPSKWMTSLSPGKKFTVTIDETGKRYDAAVIRTNPRIDPTSRTFAAIAQILGKHPELRAGMSGNADFNSMR